MYQEIARQLLQNEFIPITTNIPAITAFFHVESQCINVVQLLDARVTGLFTAESYDVLRKQIRMLFTKTGERDVHIFTVVITDLEEECKVGCAHDRDCWIVLAKSKRLIRPEGSRQDFYGLVAMIESALESGAEFGAVISYPSGRADAEASQQTFLRSGQKSSKKIRSQDIAWVSGLLIFMNVVIFLVCTFMGNTVYTTIIDQFALSWMSVFGDKEYYRVLTSMFLHGDIEHVASNMLLLFVTGEVLEKRIGRIWMTIAYLLTGMIAALSSMLYAYLSQQYIVSIGASGAVFGIIGVLLLFAVTDKRVNPSYLYRMMIMIIYSIYSGFRSDTTDNAAHIGGLLAGLLLGCILWWWNRRKQGGRRRED